VKAIATESRDFRNYERYSKCPSSSSPITDLNSMIDIKLQSKKQLRDRSKIKSAISRRSQIKSSGEDS
jgi:hypothetical protein